MFYYSGRVRSFFYFNNMCLERIIAKINHRFISMIFVFLCVDLPMYIIKIWKELYKIEAESYRQR